MAELVCRWPLCVEEAFAASGAFSLHVVERRSFRRQVRAGVGVGISAASVSYRGDDEGSGLFQSMVRSDAAGDGSHGSFNFFRPLGRRSWLMHDNFSICL